MDAEQFNEEFNELIRKGIADCYGTDSDLYVAICATTVPFTAAMEVAVESHRKARDERHRRTREEISQRATPQAVDPHRPAPR